MQLGITAKDRVTGFSGTVTGFVQYLSGCSQVLLTPKVAKDGTAREAQWFDVQRVERVGKSLIALDNSRTPGPDRMAPKR